MNAQIDKNNLNVAHLTACTNNLGPGDRAVLWVQGCPHRCPGCVAPEWLPFETARLVSPLDLVDELLAYPSVTGLTFSGGEPMWQALALANLARIARERRQLDIICFTGYRLEQLMKHPPSEGVSDLLRQIDVLIDGPYIHSLNDNTGLRGSSNQRIIHLTEKLKHLHLEKYPRRVDITIGSGQIMMVGIPPISLESFIPKTLFAKSMEGISRGQ